MEATRTKPPVLIGWRSKVTGIVYRNACTQTGKNNRYKKEKRAQTDFTTDKCTNTKLDVGVQACFFPDIRDKIVDNPFKRTNLNDASGEKVLESVVKIQRFYRAYRARQTAITSSSVSPRAKDELERETGLEERWYRSQDFVILNRVSPSTRADFELLYNLLDRWRIQETRRASEQLYKPARIAFGGLILSKEVELLRAIDSMKAKVNTKRREKSYTKFLDELCKPVVWRNGRGREPIKVDTVLVQRAKRFRDTFQDLSRGGANVDERLKTLTELRKDVEAHTCEESDELVRLLDQEIYFLTHRVEEGKLNWLRSGLNMAFLRLARECLRKGEQDTIHACRTVCTSCGRPLTVEKFPRERQGRSSSCKLRCSRGPRLVYQPYQRLLRDIRRREIKMCCYSSLAFAIDARIVYHLVNEIWDGKSAVSGNDCLEELRLVRFRNGEEWTPWNSLLLTAKEASLHRTADDLEKFYGAMILQKFHTKNLQAKVRFESVTEFKSLCGRREWCF